MWHGENTPRGYKRDKDCPSQCGECYREFKEPDASIKLAEHVLTCRAYLSADYSSPAFSGGIAMEDIVEACRGIIPPKPHAENPWHGIYGKHGEHSPAGVKW